MSSSAAAPGATLVLLHGLLGTPREFFLVSSALRRRGVRHLAPSIPGYTLAGCTWRRTPWRDWIDAAGRAIENASTPGEELILAGLCTGGLLAAGLALRLRERVRGLVMLSPTFSYDGWGL